MPYGSADVERSLEAEITSLRADNAALKAMMKKPINHVIPCPAFICTEQCVEANAQTCSASPCDLSQGHELESTNTDGPKFCFNCAPESVLKKKMVDNKYSYCPYCGKELSLP